MEIKNLLEHQTFGVTDFYTADILNGEITIHVKFTEDAQNVISMDSGLIYPIQLANGERIDIAKLKNDDEIELGIAIKRDNH